jgi:hypothetical protein
MARRRMGEQVTGLMGDKRKTPTAAEAVAAVRGVAAQPRVKRDHVKVTHMFTREQAEALRSEAMRRCDAKGSRKPDESEIVREAVELWIAKHGGKR